MSLHQQLLDATRPPAGTPLSDLDPNSWLAALRAVVEMHAPVRIATYSAGLPIRLWVCNHCASLCHSRSGLDCDEPSDGHYPCADIQAIARELGIEATDHG